MAQTFKLLITGLLAALTISISACGGSSTPATPPTPPNPGGSAELTELGIKDIGNKGTGLQALNGKTATVRYTGWLYDSTVVETADKPAKAGVQFDTNVGKNPFPFIINSGAVIQGFNDGILRVGDIEAMKVGGTRIVYIPSRLAYGTTSSGTIPANSALVFKIELLSIQ